MFVSVTEKMLFGAILFFFIFNFILVYGQSCLIDKKLYELEAQSSRIICNPELVDLGTSYKVETSSICVVTCTSNTLRYKHRCNLNGKWDIEPFTKSCSDLKQCDIIPSKKWSNWNWQCTFGINYGSVCNATCPGSQNLKIQSKW